MIVAQRKPLNVLKEAVKRVAFCEKKEASIYILGCGSCTSVCLSGGEKQAEELGLLLQTAFKKDGYSLNVFTDMISRQCDREFYRELKSEPSDCAAVLTLACGVGAGYLSEVYPETPVIPGLDTVFYGAHTAPGTFVEYCHGCGSCVLDRTAGICPVARCAKSLSSGACGGSDNGKCEVHPDMDCAWAEIYKRLTKRGELHLLEEIASFRDWSKDRSGGIRRLSYEEFFDLE